MTKTFVSCRNCVFYHALDKSCRALPKGFAAVTIPKTSAAGMQINVNGVAGYPDVSRPDDGCHSGLTVASDGDAQA